MMKWVHFQCHTHTSFMQKANGTYEENSFENVRACQTIKKIKRSNEMKKKNGMRWEKSKRMRKCEEANRPNEWTLHVMNYVFKSICELIPTAHTIQSLSLSYARLWIKLHQVDIVTAAAVAAAFFQFCFSEIYSQINPRCVCTHTRL